MTVLRFLLILALASAAASAQPASPASLRVWLERVLNWPEQRAKEFSRLMIPRGGEEWHAGERLARADLASKTESMLHECGSCWSPAVANDGRVAILKTDGVWLVPLDGTTAHLAVAAPRLRKIVGRAKDKPLRLLVVQQVAEKAGCDYGLRFANVGTGKLEAATGAPVTCFGEVELGAFRKPDTFRNRKVVSSSDPAGRFPPKLLVADMPAQGGQLLPSRDLLPWIEDDDGRLDPIWSGDTAVVYVKRGRK